MAQDVEPNVGVRLRSLRHERKLSLRALAERSGLSINAISQIERGENSPTVSSLHRLATAFGVPIADLFREQARQSTVFSRQDLRLQEENNGVVMESLGSGLYNQQLEPFRMTMGPGAGNATDPISHSGEEFIHCMHGEIECSVGDCVFRLEPGDSLLFDATQSHGYLNRSSAPATILLVFQTSQDSHRVRQLHIDSLESR
jgi:transcriptional regulator with XRE-family HTH domain